MPWFFFAWVLAQEHTPIWQGLRLAPGPLEDMYSGQAEAYGLLAALTFVQYYLSCYAMTIPPTIFTCFCDNLGVINTPTAMKMDTIAWPNDTMNDDHNLYLAM